MAHFRRVIQFDTTGLYKKRWIDGYLVIVYCIYAALSSGGKNKKDNVVVGN